MNVLWMWRVVASARHLKVCEEERCSILNDNEGQETIRRGKLLLSAMMAFAMGYIRPFAASFIVVTLVG